MGLAVAAGTLFQPALVPGPQAAAPVPAAPIDAAAVSLAGLATAPALITPAPRTPVPQIPTSQAPTPQTIVETADVQLASTLPGVPTIAQPEIARPTAAEGALLEALSPAAPLPPFAPRPLSAEPQAPVQPLDSQLQAELDACAVWLVVTPAPGAMLDLSVYAPCDQGQAVEISHAGLFLDARTGADGQLVMQIPALATEAALTITFADGRTLSDTAIVPDLAQHERVVLQWAAPASLLLHAYEFGANYGDNGHIHAGHPLAPGIQGHGFLTVLGDATIPQARLAQVYSYPVETAGRGGQVTLEIEAPVTEASCGGPLIATAYEMLSGTAAQPRTIRLDMPDCDGTGGYLVLRNVLPDLVVAMN